MSNIFVPWMRYAGVEIANGARVRDYIRNGLAPAAFVEDQLDDCEAIDDGPYVNPFTDDAPWFEATVAASEEFLGVFLNSITIDAPFTRQVARRFPDGSNVGRLEQAGRIVNVGGVLVASSGPGMQWGQRWLSEVLRCGCADCDLDDLCVLPACPPAATDYAVATDDFRVLRDTGLVDGPNFFAVDGAPQCDLLGVNWQMASRHPYLFGDKELEFSGAFSEGDAGAGAHDVCGTVDSPEWIGDVPLIIEVHTYSQPLTDVTVHVWPNNLGECPPSAASPTPIAAYTIASLPAGQILTIDGAAQKVERYDRAAKRVVEGLSAVAPLESDIILWPSVGGACRSVCVCADVDQTADTGAADVFVYSQLRET